MNTWKHLTVCKRVSLGSFGNVFINYLLLRYKYNEDLALNNLEWLICHKTKPNQD